MNLSANKSSFEQVKILTVGSAQKPPNWIGIEVASVGFAGLAVVVGLGYEGLKDFPLRWVTEGGIFFGLYIFYSLYTVSRSLKIVQGLKVTKNKGCSVKFSLKEKSQPGRRGAGSTQTTAQSPFSSKYEKNPSI